MQLFISYTATNAHDLTVHVTRHPNHEERRRLLQWLYIQFNRRGDSDSLIDLIATSQPSLSVLDIVEFESSDGHHRYRCDSFGWTELPTSH